MISYNRFLCHYCIQNYNKTTSIQSHFLLHLIQYILSSLQPTYIRLSSAIGEENTGPGSLCRPETWPSSPIACKWPSVDIDMMDESSPINGVAYISDKCCILQSTVGSLGVWQESLYVWWSWQPKTIDSRSSVADTEHDENRFPRMSSNIQI